MDNKKFTLVIPGILEEIEWETYRFQDMREVLRKVFEFRDITIKFLKLNHDNMMSFSDKPIFNKSIAPFRIYRGNKFITIAELRKW